MLVRGSRGSPALPVKYAWTAYAASAPESTSADPPGPAGEKGPARNSPATSLVIGGRRVQLRQTVPGHPGCRARRGAAEVVAAGHGPARDRSRVGNDRDAAAVRVIGLPHLGAGRRVAAPGARTVGARAGRSGAHPAPGARSGARRQQRVVGLPRIDGADHRRGRPVAGRGADATHAAVDARRSRSPARSGARSTWRSGAGRRAPRPEPRSGPCRPGRPGPGAAAASGRRCAAATARPPPRPGSSRAWSPAGRRRCAPGLPGADAAASRASRPGSAARAAAGVRPSSAGPGRGARPPSPAAAASARPGPAGRPGRASARRPAGRTPWSGGELAAPVGRPAQLGAVGEDDHGRAGRQPAA